MRRIPRAACEPALAASGSTSSTSASRGARQRGAGQHCVDERSYDEIVARSGLLTEVVHAAQLLGERSLVLLAGEAGTPKALVARLLHRAAQLDGPFVHLRCRNEPGFAVELFGDAARGRRGRVDDARGGTLFLDAIEQLSLELQASLLRLVSGRAAPSGRSGSIRVVAASECDPWALVEDGRLREDLCRRLVAHRIELSPLRERADEIAPLAQRLLYLAVRRVGGRARQLAPGTVAALTAYGWPGNVRELKRVIEALLASSEARVLELPRGWLARRSCVPERGDELADHDRQQISEALRLSNGTLAGPNGAAARLGMQVATLRFRMRRLGLSRMARDRR